MKLEFAIIPRRKLICVISSFIHCFNTSAHFNTAYCTHSRYGFGIITRYWPFSLPFLGFPSCSPGRAALIRSSYARGPKKFAGWKIAALAPFRRQLAPDPYAGTIPVPVADSLPITPNHIFLYDLYIWLFSSFCIIILKCIPSLEWLLFNPNFTGIKELLPYGTK